jgi:hypothetical protein
VKQVLCATTSEKLFKTVDEAQAILNWIRDNLHKGGTCSPVEPEIVEVEGGFRYVVYSTLDVAIPVEEFEARKASNSLPMLFDNQRFVILDVTQPQ